MSVGDQRHVPAVLPLEENTYTLYSMLRRPRGPFLTGAENLAGIRFPDRKGCSESLYRLNYSGYSINDLYPTNLGLDV
jgi:hypothetical protein